MSRTRAQRRFDDLPLFAEDRQIAEVVVGVDREKIENWLASIPTLEADGFPRRHIVYGRYTPAVKEFYQSRYGWRTPTPSASTRCEGEGTWTTRAVKRRG